MPKNDSKTVFWKWVLAGCVCSMCYGAAAAVEFQGHIAVIPSQTVSVTDMAGRKVTVPRRIDRIATIGPVPVINSYIFALGEGRKIVNGLPHFARTKKWRLQTVIAPHLAGQTMLQGSNRDVNIEALLLLRPDVVITMDKVRIPALENAGLPVLYIEWSDASDIKSNMSVLGRALDRTPRSEEYLRYFEATMDGVRSSLKGISEASKPKVLFFNSNSMTTPRLIADWWIQEAGGQSVTAKFVRTGTISYSYEHVLLWNPDIMIVSAPEQTARIYREKRISMVNAVQNKRVYSMPMGVHSWGQRTVEQPLTVLWAATKFFPDRFRHISMEEEVRNFYRRFFEYELSDTDIQWILSGNTE